MSDEAAVRGDIPADLEGAIEAARAAGNTIAATVYEEARDGKIALADARDEVLRREYGG